MSVSVGRSNRSPVRWIERAVVGLGPAIGALIDAIVLIVVLRLAEILFFGPDFYEGLGIHPFWLVVLLTTLQRGLFAGVVAASIAALAMDWPVRPMGVDIVEHYIRISILPMQWLLTALVLGLFRGAEMREREALEAALASANEDKQLLAEELARADSALDLAEIEAITRSGQRPNQLVQALGNLMSDREEPDLATAFEVACTRASSSPGLLVMLRQNRVEVVAGDETARDLFSAAMNRSTALTKAIGKARPDILESATVKQGTHGYLVVAPVCGAAAKPVGAVVLLSESRQCAERDRQSANLLAAIVTQRCEASSEP